MPRFGAVDCWAGSAWGDDVDPAAHTATEERRNQCHLRFGAAFLVFEGFVKCGGVLGVNVTVSGFRCGFPGMARFGAKAVSV